MNIQKAHEIESHLNNCTIVAKLVAIKKSC